MMRVLFVLLLLAAGAAGVVLAGAWKAQRNTTDAGARLGLRMMMVALLGLLFVAGATATWYVLRTPAQLH